MQYTGYGVDMAHFLLDQLLLLFKVKHTYTVAFDGAVMIYNMSANE